MKKTLTLSEVKAAYGDYCFETETSFGVNKFGKYRPDVTFIIPKEFAIDKNGNPIDPTGFVSDREITDNMNLDMSGDAKILFGDFWRSKKGGACFRPQDPMRAKHLLVCVSWGGAFSKTRGLHGEPKGSLYFRSASSNGGGVGNDYVVLPVGFTRVIRDEEIDGDDPGTDRTALFAERAKAYCQKHADLQRKAIEAVDKFLREKAAAEAKSAQDRVMFIERLETLESRRQENLAGKCGNSEASSPIVIGEKYFKLGNTEYLYSDENIAEAETRIAGLEKFVAENEAAARARENAKAEFEPRYEALRTRIEKCGLTLEIAKNSGSSDGWIAKVDSNQFSMSEDGITKLIGVIEKAEEKQAEAARKMAKEVAEAEAKAAGLPSDIRIWHRSGATNAGQGWVITSNGMDRDYDEIKNPRPRYQSEGWAIWRQILHGEVVLRWAHEFTAAPHEFEVIYCPEVLTEAQMERIAEIEQELEDEFLGKLGATGKPCPSIGGGWDLVERKSLNGGGDTVMAAALQKAGITG